MSEQYTAGKGQHQEERRFGRRPMMFTTNGLETYFWDDQTATQRPVSGIFSKDDLQKLMNRDRSGWS